MKTISDIFIECEKNNKYDLEKFYSSIDDFEKEIFTENLNLFIERFWSGDFNGSIKDYFIEFKKFNGDVNKVRMGFILLYGIIAKENNKLLKKFKEFLKKVVENKNLDLSVRRLAMKEAVLYGYASDFYPIMVKVKEPEIKLSFIFALEDIDLLLKSLEYAINLSNKHKDNEFVDAFVGSIVDQFNLLLDSRVLSYQQEELLRELLWKFVNQPGHEDIFVKEVLNFLIKQFNDSLAKKIIINIDRMKASQELFNLLEKFKHGNRAKIAAEIISLINKSKAYSFVFNLSIVPKLINALKTDNLDTTRINDELRNFIIRILASSKPSIETINFLKGLFKHKSEVVRRAIVEESEKLFRPEERIRLIEPLINDESPFVREAVIHELVKLKPNESIKLLIDLFLTERDNSVRSIIFNYLLKSHNSLIIDKLLNQGVVSPIKDVVNKSIKLLSNVDWPVNERIKIICFFIERAKTSKSKKYIDYLKQIKFDDFFKLNVNELINFVWFYYHLNNKDSQDFYTVCKSLFNGDHKLFGYKISDGFVKELQFSYCSKSFINSLTKIKEFKELHLETISLDFCEGVNEFLDKIKDLGIKRLILYLPNNKIPLNMFKIKSLTYLYLYSEEGGFKIPDEIKQLKDLEVLDVSELVYLPESILELKKLKKIKVHRYSYRNFFKVINSRSKYPLGSVIDYEVNDLIKKLRERGVKFEGDEILAKEDHFKETIDRFGRRDIHYNHGIL